jgi:hypothetical protein
MAEKRQELLEQMAYTTAAFYNARDSQTIVDRVKFLRLYCDSFIEVWE